jgi:hypothetical protein
MKTAIPALRWAHFLQRLFLSFLVLSMAVAALHASAQNSAQGTITVNGKKTELKHAYAFPIQSGSLKMRLLVSDQPLSTKALADHIARILELRANKVQTLIFSFGDKNQLLGVQFAVPPLEGSWSHGDLKSEGTNLTDKAFKGRVYAVGTQTFVKETFAFDVRFDAGVFAATKY